MSLLDKTRRIERLQFFDGMRLFGDDLKGLEAFNREMREFHNSSLHPWGLGNGFAVYGKRGDREVTIGAGYAIDKDGHEIVLPQERKEPVPPVAGEPDGSPVVYDLVVSYPEDDQLEEAETRAGICDARGVTRLREEPIFCWVRYKRTENNQYVAVDPRLGAEIESGVRLVLARVEVQNCQLKKDISLAERRNARPAKGPHISCNAFAPAPWEPYWLLDLDDLIELLVSLFERVESPEIEETPTPLVSRLGLESLPLILRFVSPLSPFVLPIGIQAQVDTRLGSFRGVPGYFTRIAGTRVLDLQLVALAEYLKLIDRATLDVKIMQVLDGLGPVRLYTEGLPTVSDPHVAQFQFQASVILQFLLPPSSSMTQRALETAGDLTPFQILREHVEQQIQKHPVMEMIRNCNQANKAERKKCLKEAAREAIRTVEDAFIKFLIPADWEIIWMGIEE